MNKVILFSCYLLISLMVCTANLQGQENFPPENFPPQSRDDLEQMKERIHQMREMAKDAKENGDMDKARELMEQSKRMERELKEAYERRKEILQQEQRREKDQAKRMEREPKDGRDRREEPIQQNQIIEKVYAFLKEFYPEKLQRLERLKQERPDAYFREIKENLNQIQQLEKLKQHDPARFEEEIQLQKLEGEGWKLSELYRYEQNTAKKEEIKQKLRTVLNNIFEYKTKQHQKEIDRLNQDLEKLKKRIQTRVENKDKIIEKRLQEMTGEKDEFEW